MELTPTDLNVSTWSRKPKSSWVITQDNGIRVSHKPTGIAVKCDKHRSQHKNKQVCIDAIRYLLNNNGR